MEFSKLERAAIEQILSKPMNGMDGLRRQFEAASVVKREYTGVGFYTTVSVPSSVPPVEEYVELQEQLQYGAGATIRSDPHEMVAFKLWTNAGYIACLEGVTTNNFWPDESEIDVVACRLERREERKPQSWIRRLFARMTRE